MIDTVSLDAGGVLCHPSWTRVADALVRHGAMVTPAALAVAEQRATHELDQAAVIGATDDPGARGHHRPDRQLGRPKHWENHG